MPGIEEVLERLLGFGIAMSPTQPDTWLLNMDIAIDAFSLEDNEACRMTVFDSLELIAIEHGYKLEIVKQSSGSDTNEV